MQRNSSSLSLEDKSQPCRITYWTLLLNKRKINESSDKMKKHLQMKLHCNSDIYEFVHILVFSSRLEWLTSGGCCCCWCTGDSQQLVSTFRPAAESGFESSSQTLTSFGLKSLSWETRLVRSLRGWLIFVDTLGYCVCMCWRKCQEKTLTQSVAGFFFNSDLIIMWLFVHFFDT